MSNNFYFTFYPTHERPPNKARATHYPRNRGIITFSNELLDYLYACRIKGKRPELFAQGWYSKRENTFNAGFAIPRDTQTQDLAQNAHSKDHCTLADLLCGEHDQ